jgi:NTE family protein
MRIGLALSGGGARGLAHLGVLEALDSLGIVPGAIAGTSAGAVLGVLRAADIPLPRMIEIAATTRWPKLVRPVLPGRAGLLTLEPMDDVLYRALGHRRRFSELSIPFACLATDIERDRSVVIQEGELAPAIRASCSVPGVFIPVELRGQLLVDGGVLNNLPVSVLHDMGADYVIAVDLLPARVHPRRPESWAELITVTFYNMVRASSREGILADALIVPEIRDFSFTDFEQRHALIAEGRNAVERAQRRLLLDLDPLRELRRRWAAFTGRLRSMLRAFPIPRRPAPLALPSDSQRTKR